MSIMMREDTRRRLGIPPIERLAKRARLLALVREFFHSRDYIEIEAPILVPAPGLEVNIAALRTEVCGGTAYLHTSPEFALKKLVAAGAERIYAMGRVFRDGELSPCHNPEFTMLEWYRTEADAESMMVETEALLAHVSSAFGVTLPAFARVSFADAFLALGIDFEHIARDDVATFRAAAQAAGVRTLADDDFDDVFHRVCIERIDKSLPRAVFVHDYPVELAVLARKNPKRPRFSERFELIIDGLELCNGFSELTDPVEQRQRFSAELSVRARRGLPVYPLDEAFLSALRTLPVCGGNAMGIDRLAMLALGVDDIAAVSAFSQRSLFGLCDSKTARVKASPAIDS